MKLVQQLVNLKLSIKLHELNITKPSIFYTDSTKNKNSEIEIWDKPYYCPDNINRYTVAELGEMLPEFIFDKNGVLFQLTITKNSSFYFTDYINKLTKNYRKEEMIGEKELSNSMAKMLILLKGK